MGSIGVKMKSWVDESDFLFRDARVPRQQPSISLQASVRDNQNASAAGSPSKPEDYHRVNTLSTSLDKVLAEIEDRFSGNDQVVLCDYYNFDKVLLHGDQRLFNRFKKHMSKNQ